VRERIREVGERYPYHVFISYSHDPDRWRATRLRRRLQAIGRRWWERRRFRVFQDITDLPADHDLREKINDNLRGSAKLALLASRRSANSKWVTEELEFWKENRSDDPPLIIHTDGHLDWDDDKTHDFRWAEGEQENVLNRAVFSGWYQTLPIWVTFVPERVNQYWPLRWLWQWRQFTVAAVSIAAAVLDIDQETLAAHERRRQQRRFGAVATAGLLVTALAITSVWYASSAREQARLKNAQQLVTAAGRARTDVSLLLHASAYEEAPERHGLDLWEQALASRNLRRVPRMPSGPDVGTLDSVAFSPDGRWLAAATRRVGVSEPTPATVVLWPGSGEGVGTAVPVPGLMVSANALAFSKDGRWLAVGDNRGQVALVATTAAAPGIAVQPTAILSGSAEEPVDRVSFAPDGTRLAVSHLHLGDQADTIQVWDLTSQSELLAFQGRRGAFSPDGTTLAAITSEDGRERIVIRDARSLAVTATAGSERVIELRDLDYRGDGKALAVLAQVDTPGVWLVDVPAPAAGSLRLRPVAENLGGSTLAYGDQDLIAVDGGGLISQASSPRPSLGHSLIVAISRSVAFRPGTKNYAVAGRWISPTAPGVVFLMDAGSAESSGTPSPVRGMGPSAASPDGKSVAMVGTDGKVNRLSVDTGQPVGAPLASSGTTPSVLRFSPSGELLAGVNGRAVFVWKLTDGRVRTRYLPVASPRYGNNDIGGLGFSPDSSLLAVAGQDRGVTILPTGPTFSSEERTLDDVDVVTDLAFSPDGHTLAAATASGIRRWDTTRWRSLRTLRVPDGEPTVTRVTFVSANRLAGAVGQRLYTWDVSSGIAKSLPNAGSAAERFTQLAVNPQGTLLAAASSANSTLSVWNLSTRRRVAVTLSEPVPLAAISFTSDGLSLLVSGRTITLIKFDPRYWLEWICDVVQRNLTRQEWQTYGAGRRRHICEAWPLE
jgi:WD40 repeat protein